MFERRNAEIGIVLWFGVDGNWVKGDDWKLADWLIDKNGPNRPWKIPPSDGGHHFEVGNEPSRGGSASKCDWMCVGSQHDCPH